MISGAMTLGEPEALKWAQELLQNHPYLKNSPTAIRRFRHFAGTGKDYKGMDINQASHLRNLEAYDKRLGIPKELPDLPRVETVQPVESDPHTNPRIPEVADDPQQTQQDRNSYASYIGITLFSACVAFLIFRKRVL